KPGLELLQAIASPRLEAENVIGQSVEIDVVDVGRPDIRRFDGKPNRPLRVQFPTGEKLALHFVVGVRRKRAVENSGFYNVIRSRLAVRNITGEKRLCFTS